MTSKEQPERRVGERRTFVEYHGYTFHRKILSDKVTTVFEARTPGSDRRGQQPNNMQSRLTLAQSQREIELAQEIIRLGEWRTLAGELAVELNALRAGMVLRKVSWNLSAAERLLTRFTALSSKGSESHE